jgi:hypothetical protein
MSSNRKSEGIDLLRRVLGLGIGKNQSVAFTPTQCLSILKDLDARIPRSQNKKPKYQYDPPQNLRS